MTGERTAKRTKTASSSAKTGSEQGKNGASTGRRRAPAGTKRARSGWKPTAGGRLREQLDANRGPKGIEVLIEQAARCADRLEALDRLHHGDVDALMRLELGRVVAEATPARERKAFYVDVALKLEPTIAEERQQAKLLSSLLGDIFRQRASLPPEPPSGCQEDDLDLD